MNVDAGRADKRMVNRVVRYSPVYHTLTWYTLVLQVVPGHVLEVNESPKVNRLLLQHSHDATEVEVLHHTC